MAARQDQGLVFTLIAFVILFIIAFVAAYMGWKSYSDSQQQLASMQEQKRAADAAVATKVDENNRLRVILGVGENDSNEDLEKTYEDDMKKYGTTFNEDQRSYRNVVEYLAKEKAAISSSEAAAKDSLKQANEKLLTLEAENSKKIAQFESQMKAAQDDAASERNQHRQDREGLEKTKQELQDNLAKQKTIHETQLAEVSANLKDVTEKFTKSEHAKENLLAEVSKSAESFEVPDGRISWVNQDGTVWINLGAADSLRRQISFSVFDADAQDPAKTEQKGSIEVTRILGDHMAEARITNDDYNDPILTGDQIYSQVWHRGKKLRFALAGIIDLNNDGKNDMKLARDLIELNGGVVDAYVDDQGKIQGEITVNTRYLVLGSHPEGADQARLQEAWTTISADAKVSGVEVISLDKFLNQIGYQPGERVVRLGRDARAADFPAKPEPGADAQPGQPSVFRPRTPSRPSGNYFRFSP